MLTGYTNFTASLTKRLTDYIEHEASRLNSADIERLLVNLPLLRQRLNETAAQKYPDLLDQFEFLALVVKSELPKLHGAPIPQPLAEAAHALLYCERTADLIPDRIPALGLLDDAVVINIVIRRHEATFRSSPHAGRLRWPLSPIKVDGLLSVVSPLRMTEV
jgi:uncharacterized membrane protein YkvA (DUF1232 family)